MNYDQLKGSIFFEAQVAAASVHLVVWLVPERRAGDDLSLGARIYNIRDFGAKGDGSTLDTAAVQAAIDACNKDQGGTPFLQFVTFKAVTLNWTVYTSITA